uniref:Calponin-homology (CH) domain-containing protein n=1 Tax=Arcella intermedia TaxID=1963864 RepID=A0A6B2KXP6_9EUKA
MNALRPGIIPTFAQKPKHYLEEKDNIKKFLNACLAYGVPSQDLFTEFDLGNSPDPVSVMMNMYSLSRQSQAHGFRGATIGATYYKSVEQQRLLEEKKQAERQAENERKEKVALEQMERRIALEKEQKERYHETKQKIEKSKNRRKKKRVKRERKLVPFQEPLPADVEFSPVKYGFDREVHLRNQEKFQPRVANAVMDWIEDMTGEEVDYFWHCLKSGRLLCMIINAVFPGKLKINPPGIGLNERDNIQRFIKMCETLGVKQQDLFDVNDLHTNKNPVAVLYCIISLAKKLEFMPSYEGPKLNLPPSAIAHLDESESSSDIGPALPSIDTEDTPKIFIVSAGRPRPNTTKKPFNITARHSSDESPPSPDLSTVNDPLIPPSPPEKPFKKPIFQRIQAKKNWIFLLYSLVLLLCGGGNFGEVWLRGVPDNGYFSIDMPVFPQGNNNATDASYRDISLLGTFGNIFGWILGGLCFDILGPKITISTGLLWKIVGIVLISLNTNGQGAQFAIAGYVLFQIGGPFIMLTAFQDNISNLLFKKRRTITKYTFYAAIYTIGGTWLWPSLHGISSLISSSGLFVSLMIYVGILSVALIASFILSPLNKDEPEEDKTPTPSHSSTQFPWLRSKAVFSDFHLFWKDIHIVFLLIFGSVILCFRANYLWYELHQNWNSLQSTYELYVLGSLGLVGFLFSLFSETLLPNQMHFFPILTISIVEVVLGIISEASFIARVSCLSVYLPYAIGIIGSILVEKEVRSYLGLCFTMIGLMSLVMNLVPLIDRILSSPFIVYFVLNISAIVILLLLMGYPILYFLIGKKYRRV